MSPSEKLTNVMLNSKNYLSWTRAVSLSLSGRGKLDYITGFKQKPILSENPSEINQKNATEWQMSDHMVMSWLFSSMEPDIGDLFIYSESSQELWSRAESLYGNKNNYAYFYQLKLQMAQIKQQGQSITTVLSKFQKLKDEARVYRPPTTDIEKIRRRERQYDLFHFLACLDSSYEAVRSQILLSAELPA